MRYSVILFDLDGTILNTLDDLAASTNRALAKNGLPTRSTEEVRRFAGNGIRLLIERAVPSSTPLTLTDRVFDDFRTDYAEHCADRTLPYDGIPELLRALRASGARTAVISNKADSAVQELIAHYFPGLLWGSAPTCAASLRPMRCWKCCARFPLPLPTQSTSVIPKLM